MANESTLFSDSAAYERFMGSWTRAVGAKFLDWIAAADGQRLLEVGCGTGIFTEMLVKATAPREIIAIDPAPTQIELAKGKPFARDVDFRIADAQALPFANGDFDLAVSALVINFIPDQARAMAEMRRVVKPAGLVAGYVWDFTGDLNVARHIQIPLRKLNPNLPKVIGADSSRLEPLINLFAGAGFENVTGCPIEAEVTYPSFDAYWRGFIENPSAQSAYIKALPSSEFERFRDTVRSTMPIKADGTITFSARAHAVKGFVSR